MARGRYPPIRQTAPVHINWKQMRTYKALYRSKSGVELTVRSVSKPPRSRTFRTSAGNRKFKLVKLQSSMREVLIVAKTKTRKKAVDKDELEEIEALEELEELEEEDEDEEDEDVEEDEDDEEEPEDEEDEDEDEEDEEPAPKKSKRSKTTKTAKKSTKSRASENGKVGTQEVAAAAGIDARQLRMVLRRNDIPVDEDSNRYEWSSLKHPQVLKILKLVKGGAAKRVQQEKLAELKEKKAKKASARGATSPKGKTSTKKRTKSRG